MLMENEENGHFLFLCGEKDTGKALISFRFQLRKPTPMPTKLSKDREMILITYRIVAFRYIYSRNIFGGTCLVPWIFSHLHPSQRGNPDNRRIFPIAGLSFSLFPESSHAFDICYRARWLWNNRNFLESLTRPCIPGDPSGKIRIFHLPLSRQPPSNILPADNPQDK